jgi:hypothetical protein
MRNVNERRKKMAGIVETSSDANTADDAKRNSPNTRAFGFAGKSSTVIAWPVQVSFSYHWIISGSRFVPPAALGSVTTTLALETSTGSAAKSNHTPPSTLTIIESLRSKPL